MFLSAKIAKNQGPTEQWLSPKNLMIRANSDFFDSDTKMFPPRKQSQLIDFRISKHTRAFEKHFKMAAEMENIAAHRCSENSVALYYSTGRLC